MSEKCNGRITKDRYFMNIAIEVSRRSTCSRRQIGAIIVSDVGEIKSTGYNGNPRGLPHCDEMGCIRDQLGIRKCRLRFPLVPSHEEAERTRQHQLKMLMDRIKTLKQKEQIKRLRKIGNTEGANKLAKKLKKLKPSPKKVVKAVKVLAQLPPKIAKKLVKTIARTEQAVLGALWRGFKKKWAKRKALVTELKAMKEKGSKAHKKLLCPGKMLG